MTVTIFKKFQTQGRNGSNVYGPMQRPDLRVPDNDGGVPEPRDVDKTRRDLLPPTKTFQNLPGTNHIQLFCFPCRPWSYNKIVILDVGYLKQRTLTYFVRGNITVRLTSCLTGLDSAVLLNWSYKQICLFGQILVKQEVSRTVFST